MNAQHSARWAALSGLIALGLLAGQTLRSRPATASTVDECTLDELADFVELRRVGGAAPIEPQEVWGTLARFHGDSNGYGLHIDDEVLKDFGLAIELETAP